MVPGYKYLLAIGEPPLVLLAALHLALDRLKHVAVKHLRV